MKPWYRESWTWGLMAGPAAVLVAGAITTWIAFATADGLVAEDYYREGRGINRVLAREEAARRLGIEAAVTVEGGRLRVTLQGEAPAALFVHLMHATRAGHDQRLRLAPALPGIYEAALEPLPPGRWRAAVEDPGARWRIITAIGSRS